MYTTLDTSDWRLWVMCVIIVGCLAFWLVAVFMAARNPSARAARTGMKGPVQGGRHVAAGGRSVSPARDQPAMDSDDPVAEHAADQDAAAAPAAPQQRPSVPRPARDRDASVPMPPPRSESSADSTQHTNRY